MYVKFVDLQFLCCLISRTSPVLLNVYVVLPSSMWGQVRHPCLELQRKVPCENKLSTKTRLRLVESKKMPPTWEEKS